MVSMLRRLSAVCLLNWSVALASCTGDECNSPTTQGNALLQQRKQTHLSKVLVEDEGGQGTTDRVLASERMNSSVDIISVASYDKREDIPGGCKLTGGSKVPDGGRCLFNDQCANKFCCPYFRVCNEGALTNDQVEADPLIKSIMWSEKYGGGSVCGLDICDTCAFRDSKAYQCKEVNGGPILKGDPHASIFGLWNIKDPVCKCDHRFIAAFEAGTWVKQCKGSGTATPEPTTTTTTTTTTPEPEPESKPAPVACVDSATYKDPQWHDTCAQWKGYYCTEYSFSPELIANCPDGCSTCSPTTQGNALLQLIRRK